MSPRPSSRTSVLDGGRLGTLVFRWIGDRFAHQWEFESDSDRVCIASKDETAESGWCASPPLQQIHAQEFGDGRRVIFGVGMAGRGHWSASFTLVPDLDCWIIELACRSPVEPVWLGSSYQVDEGWTTAEPDGDLHRIFGGGRIELQPIAPTTRLELESGEIRVLPASILSGAATTQWAFRVRVAE